MSIPLSNVLNFRDVGLTINTYLGERYVPLLKPSHPNISTDDSGKGYSTAQHGPVRRHS